MKPIPITLLSLALLCFSALEAEESGFVCNGYMTALYSGTTNTIAICHGPYMKFDTKERSNWNQCGDSVIYSINKLNREQKVIADCSPMINKEFRVVDGKLEIQHYTNQLKGTEQLPFVLELYDVEDGGASYQYSYNPEKYTKKDIDGAIELIEKTISSPFDGKTYFNNIYSSFYKFRDYAVIDHQVSMDILNTYKERAVFDGEVAETLGGVIDDVLLIERVIKSNGNR